MLSTTISLNNSLNSIYKVISFQGYLNTDEEFVQFQYLYTPLYSGFYKHNSPKRYITSLGLNQIFSFYKTQVLQYKCISFRLNGSITMENIFFCYNSD